MSSMYIRTKDGVYEVDEIKTYFLDEKQKLFINNELKIAVNENQVIKEADTIEELCDGVIEKCLSDNRFHYIFDFNKQEAMEVMNIDINKGYKEFYFGIFVNRNNKIDFISVAKMNDKGDLLLI